MKDYDVAIIGGGPAGSSTAWGLRHSGLNVVVIDRAHFPRDKVCAGWITPPVFELLEINPDDYGAHHTLQPITGFKTGVLGNQLITTRYDHTVSYGIRRSEFDEYLLKRCGAETLTGFAVNALQRMNGRWHINGQISSQILIGAGGNFCPVARHVRAGETNPFPLVRAQEIEFRLPDDALNQTQIDPAFPELFFCDDMNGYGWCFRKQNFINVGLGHFDSTQLRSRLATLIETLMANGLSGVTIPSRMHGHAYRTANDGATYGSDGVLLVGDSAGLASPASGEGIRPAIESGLAAAELIVDSFPHLSQDRLTQFTHWIQSRYVTSVKVPSMFQSMTARFARMALRSRLLTRHLVLNHCFLNSHGDTEVWQKRQKESPC